MNMSQTGPDPSHIMQIGMGFWASKTLLSAVELGLFTELSSGGLTAPQIAGRLDLHERSRADFLDALVSLGLLARENGELLRLRFCETNPILRLGRETWRAVSWLAYETKPAPVACGGLAKRTQSGDGNRPPRRPPA